jgi:hypothetical protein
VAPIACGVAARTSFDLRVSQTRPGRVGVPLLVHQRGIDHRKAASSLGGNVSPPTGAATDNHGTSPGERPSHLVGMSLVLVGAVAGFEYRDLHKRPFPVRGESGGLRLQAWWGRGGVGAELSEVIPQGGQGG